MPDKTAPVGICDLCGEAIPRDRWYTRRGPRLHCSDECRNTANSRAGAHIRAEKARERVAAGTWYNPRSAMTPEQISQAQSKASRKGRLREVEEGRWRNPALEAEARAKLSRPRRHADNPALHRAMEKLRDGTMADLTPEERAAYRQHCRELAQSRRCEIREYRRRRYQERVSTPEGREAERLKWQRERIQRAQRLPNDRLRRAREAAGLSQAALAERLGVSQGAVSQWERFGAVPREAEMRRRAEDLLGGVFE